MTQFLDDFRGTITDYNRAIELDPAFAFVYSNRGNIFFALRKYEQAIADYTRSIELDPSVSDNYVHRAYASSNSRSGDEEQIRADFCRYVALAAIERRGWACS